MEITLGSTDVPLTIESNLLALSCSLSQLPFASLISFKGAKGLLSACMNEGAFAYKVYDVFHD